MSKKLKFIICLIIILAIIGTIFGSLAIYRFFTFQKIFKKIDEIKIILIEKREQTKEQNGLRQLINVLKEEMH